MSIQFFKGLTLNHEFEKNSQNLFNYPKSLIRICLLNTEILTFHSLTKFLGCFDESHEFLLMNILFARIFFSMNK
jgi:hypothetical protein